MVNVIETERLILRTWKDQDVEAYYLINQDDNVMEFLPKPSLTMPQVSDFISKMNIQMTETQYTLWAVELKETGKMIGFIGLNYTDWESSFTPAVEVGWRLGSQYWGKGYATEGAKACIDYGFNKIGLEEIISFTAIDNIKSTNVMKKLGLKEDIKAAFNMPKLPLDHPLSKHVLYRITKNDIKNK
jgi:RimJ/RimL family protein N-acetyltransferase